MKIVYFFLALLSTLCAQEFQKPFSGSNWPAAITFMVADFKYNSEQGVKICEVQHGSTSAFTLGRYPRDGECVTSQLFADAFRQWTPHCWIKTQGISDKVLYATLEMDDHWETIPKFKNLTSQDLFKNATDRPVSDLGKINDYHAICYGPRHAAMELSEYQDEYPGILIIDQPTFPYWTDKYLMGFLFRGDPVLEKVKPVWKLYQKTCPALVCEKVKEEIPGHYVVIKPRKTFLSKGVLIVHKEELLSILTLIIDQPSQLKKHPDKSFQYWSSDRSPSFLVEEFIESDPVLAENGKWYDATYRSTFIISYEQEEITLRILDTYLKYPQKSLDETGTYTEKHASHPAVMQVGFIPPETTAEIEQQLSAPLMMMFEKMLSAER